jgi:hypothetical protein
MPSQSNEIGGVSASYFDRLKLANLSRKHACKTCGCSHCRLLELEVKNELEDVSVKNSEDGEDKDKVSEKQVGSKDLFAKIKRKWFRPPNHSGKSKGSQP